MRLIFLVFLATAVAAQESFPLGRTELAEAPRDRGLFRGASSAYGHLAVWLDLRASDEGDIMAMRLRGDGTPLDGEGLVLGRRRGGPFAVTVASDGRDFLVAWSDHGLRVARVTREGKVFARADALTRSDQKQLLLVSNGSSYLYRYREDGQSYVALLDADGDPISGSLRFRDDVVAATRTHSGAYLVMSRDFYGVVRGGVLGEDQFPSRGRSATLPQLPRIIERARNLKLQTDERGIYSIYSVLKGPRNFLVYQRHDGQTGATISRPLEIFWDYPDEWEVHTVTSERSLHIATIGPYYGQQIVLREVSQSGRMTERARPGGAASPGWIGALLNGAGGPLLIWGDERFWSTGAQMYAAVIASRPWTAGGTLLSRSRRAQSMPRIAAGSRGLLAVWREIDARSAVVARLIASDGRPLTEPVVIVAPGATVDDLAVAFDGERFLVVWGVWEHGGVMGRFVDPDGRPAGDPFLIDARESRIASLLWDENRYVLTGLHWVLQFDRAGNQLTPPEYEGLALYTALCAECSDRYAGLAIGPSSWDVATPYFEVRSFATPDWDTIHFSRLPFEAGWDFVKPALARRGNTFFGILYSGGSLRSYPHGSELPYNVTSSARRMQAEWNGHAFIVAAGGTIAVHDAEGALIHHESIGDDVVASAFALEGAHAVTMVYQRGEPVRGSLERIEAKRIEVAKRP
jgi:hypothetical protein